IRHNSAGVTRTVNNVYPQDFILSGSPELARQDLISKHILYPVLQQQTIEGTSDLITVKNYLEIFPNALVLPRSIHVQNKSNPLEKRVEFHDYNQFGKLLEQSNANDTKHSYVWDYNTSYPIAEATNAPYSDIAYSSFEA